MNEKKTESTVKLTQNRYEELLAKEERLRLLEIALAGLEGGYSDVKNVKTIFGIGGDKK